MNDYDMTERNFENQGSKRVGSFGLGQPGSVNGQNIVQITYLTEMTIFNALQSSKILLIITEILIQQK